MCHFYWTNPAGSTTVRSCAGWDFKKYFYNKYFNILSPAAIPSILTLTWLKFAQVRSSPCSLPKKDSFWLTNSEIVTDRLESLETAWWRKHSLVWIVWEHHQSLPRVNGFEINRGRTGVSVSVKESGTKFDKKSAPTIYDRRLLSCHTCFSVFISHRRPRLTQKIGLNKQACLEWDRTIFF